MGIQMDGKILADKICLDLKARCDVLNSRNINPVLTIVTSGEDSASKVYVRNKVKRCEEIGIKADVRHYDKLNRIDINPDRVCRFDAYAFSGSPVDSESFTISGHFVYVR